jgi:hypothetical protein
MEAKMKTMRFLWGLCLGFSLAGCSRDEVKDFMPGTYVNSAGGEFSMASDTLKIELIEGNNYVVHRATGFHIISEGKLGAREYETEQWSCAYSKATKTLTELRKGKIISFFPEREELSVGRRVYKKLN